MDELEISGKRFISTARAAKEHKYHSDYIGQLVRGGKVTGQKVGRSWYVDADSLAEYLGKEVPPRGPKAKPALAPEPVKVAPYEEKIEVLVEEKQPEPVQDPLKSKFARRPHVIAAIDIDVKVDPKKAEIIEPAVSQPVHQKVIEHFTEEETTIEAPETPIVDEEEIFIPVKVEPSPKIALEDSFYKIPSKGLKYITAHTKRDLVPEIPMEEAIETPVASMEAYYQPEKRAVKSRYGFRTAVLASMIMLAGIVSLSAGVLVSYYLHSNTTVDTKGQVSGLIFSQ